MPSGQATEERERERRKERTEEEESTDPKFLRTIPVGKSQSCGITESTKQTFVGLAVSKIKTLNS